MLSPSLREYLAKVKSYNPTASEQDLRLLLKSSGWKPEEIEEGIASNKTVEASVADPGKRFSLPPIGDKSNTTKISDFPKPPQEEPYDLMPQPRKPSVSYTAPDISGGGSGKKIALIIIVVIILVLVGGGITYAVMNGIDLKKFNPFVKKAETSHLIVSILDSAKNIKSNTTTLDVSIGIEARDADAVPFAAGALFALANDASPLGGNVEDLIADSSLNMHMDAIRTAAGGSGVSDGQSKIKVTAKFLGMDYAIDGELRKKAETYFAILREIPRELFDASDILGKWIKFTEEDIGAFYPSSYFGLPSTKTNDPKIQEMQQKLEQALRILANIADEEKLFTVLSTQKETVNGYPATKYNLTLDQAPIIAFYKRATNELYTYFGGAGSMSREPDPDVLQYLQGEEFKKGLTYWKKNTSLAMWIDDSNGYLLKSEVGVRIVPDDAQLAGKQIRMKVTGAIGDINKPLTVEEPTPTISADEAERIISGLTLEEWQLKRQKENIQSITIALRSYNFSALAYPESLGDLTKPAGSTSQILKKVPVDIYTNKPFGYKKKGDNYELTYTIKLPKYRKGMPPTNYCTRIIYVDNYPEYVEDCVNGINTATTESPSLEVYIKPRKDTDGDKVSDATETFMGTNKFKKDTDGDKVNDGDEIRRGTDPLGPGSLKVSDYSSPFLF